jgi:hypothetical protein
MTATQPCGLNGCPNPTDPDSPIGRCMDCTAPFLANITRQREADAKRRAAMTGRAPVDAILLAQAFLRDDDAAGQVIINNCDIHSVSLQLCGWIYACIRERGADVEERLAIWLNAMRAEIGESA